MSMFNGHQDAYGKFQFEDKLRADGKVKGHGITVRARIVPEVWDLHLFGKQQLGVIPINADNKCKFGAIDIDDYSVNDKVRRNISALIKQYELPLIQFRSKSGGIHLFLFTSEFVEASMMQERLRAMSSLIGYGNSEIFPKQSRLLSERGDVGQWINMPYFGGEKSDRVAYDLDTKELTINEFVEYQSEAVITGEALRNFKFPQVKDLPGGPPCLQTLIQQGFPEGTRNNGLYNMAIYAQKAYPDNWPEKVEEYNAKYMRPPLSSTETLTVVKSLQGTDYTYSCTKQPICNYCNSSVCRTRKFGIGQTAGLPVMGSLTKLASVPPLWFIEIENAGRLELTTEQLQNPRLFQRCCMNTFTTMPPVVTQHQWQTLIGELMINASIITVPDENTPIGRFRQHLIDFCVNRRTEDMEDILKGMVWANNYLYYFRMTDFLQFLERKRFDEFPDNKIIALLRDIGVQHKQIRVGKKHNINLNFVKFFSVTEEDPLPTPEQPRTESPI